MSTGLYVGPVARALHGADLAYPVAFLAALLLYTPLRVRRRV
jgi:NCS1 family nucleobase:cation symporter-1